MMTVKGKNRSLRQLKTRRSIESADEAWDASDGKRLREIRESLSARQKKFTQQRLAQKLHVKQALVSAWESGSRRPSSRTLWKIAGLPMLGPDEAKWLTGKAGADWGVIDFVKQKELSDAGAAPVIGETVRLRPLFPAETGESVGLILDGSLIRNHAVTRYLRLKDEPTLEFQYFSRGDFLLVDTSQRNMAQLPDRAIICFSVGPEPWGAYLRRAGKLPGEEKSVVTYFGEVAPGKEFILGVSGGSAFWPQNEDFILHGRVVGWKKAE
jgi:transcriptional regulator with XRE-family HTH domain